MHAKYEVSISYGSKVIAKVKVDNRQTDKQTDKQTDRTKKNNMPPIIRSGGIKIIGKEHDFLQNFPYILWRFMHETIFNQKQVLQGTIFIIYSYCKYNKLYVRQILWSLNHIKVIAISGYSGVYFRLKYLHAIVTFKTHSLGIFFSWNGDHGLKCEHYVPSIFIIV